MRILKIWDSEYPWDVRVEKISNALIEKGHYVSLICRNRYNKKKFEKLEKLEIYRLPYYKLLGKLNNPLSFPAFFNPVWIFQTYNLTKKIKPDILLVRDLPLALCAILVGKLLNVKVILDMAEPYPELIKLIWKFQKLQIKNILIRNPVFAEIVENIVLKYIDYILVVVDESKSRLIKKGFKEKNICVVTNATSFNSVKIEHLPEVYIKDKNKIKIIYLGLLGESRGLQTVIKALPIVLKEAPEVHLYIIGTGSAENSLKELTKNLSLNSNVTFLGWIENKESARYLKYADIGIIPHFSCGHWNNTIPNKLFDYMASGIPVIASDVFPMRRILSEENCGIAFKSGDHRDCAEAIILLTKKNKREYYGKKGNQSVNLKYNWDIEKTKLIEFINEVVLYGTK